MLPTRWKHAKRLQRFNWIPGKLGKALACMLILWMPRLIQSTKLHKLILKYNRKTGVHVEIPMLNLNSVHIEEVLHAPNEAICGPGSRIKYDWLPQKGRENPAAGIPKALNDIEEIDSSRGSYSTYRLKRRLTSLDLASRSQDCLWRYSTGDDVYWPIRPRHCLWRRLMILH